MKEIKGLSMRIAAGLGLAYFSAISVGCNEKASDKTSAVVKSIVSDTGSSVTLSPVLPFDVTIGSGDSILETQIRADFDRFSWESFVALNWSQDSTQQIGQNGDNSTVWESWKENYEVFRPDGSKPDPWNSTLQVKQKTLVQVGKTPTVLTDVSQPFLTGPLIDQNGQYARFEILMNQKMFDYINSNTLYNYQGQLAFTDTIRFPAGSSDKKTYGAVMVKASWKILGNGDDTSRFHKSVAVIHVPAIRQGKGIRDTTFRALVGLVGLHFGTKSIQNPQWIWSTFEQVDNAPTFNMVKDQHYNFFSNADTAADINNAPAHPWDPNRRGQLPSQIVRLTPVFSGTQALNDAFHEKLKAVNPKSVWQYYELVGTQWPVHTKQSRTGDPFPVYMANSTLETYIQGIVRNDSVRYVAGVTSSCIGCHNGATTLAGRTSDFTYLLRTAALAKKK